MLSCNGIKAGDPGAMADYYEGLAPEDFQWQQRPSSSHSATDPNGGSNLKPAAQTACGCMSLEGRETPSAIERQLNGALPTDLRQMPNGCFGRGTACCRWHETGFRPLRTVGRVVINGRFTQNSGHAPT